MNINIAETWAPSFRDAVEEVMRDNTRYITKDEIDLENTADPEPWYPSTRFRVRVPYFDEIEVVLIDDSTKLGKVHNHLREEKVIGLVVLGAVIDRKTKPSLVVLTTKTKLYVIDPNSEIAIKFLCMKLIDKGLSFWTTNGLEEADCLHGNYKIDLSSQITKVKCCSGLNIHFMKLLKSYPLAFKLSFPHWAAERSERRHQRLEKFEDLIEMWLEIDRVDVEFAREQLAHLNTRPLSTTAINIIKKRCILVLPLAMQMERVSWFEASIMSRTIYKTLTSCGKNKVSRRMMVDGIEQSRARGKVAHVGYYNHLDLFYLDEENQYSVQS